MRTVLPTVRGRVGVGPQLWYINKCCRGGDEEGMVSIGGAGGTLSGGESIGLGLVAWC